MKKIDKAISLIINSRELKKDFDKLSAKDRMLMRIELLKILSKEVKQDPKEKKKTENQLDKLFK